MNKLTLKRIAVGAILIAFALPVVVLAQAPVAPSADFGLENTKNIGLAQNDFETVVYNILQFALGFLGLIAVIIILWGGFLWMTSAGEETKVEKAKKLIVSGIVGIVIILAAWIIASFAINTIGDQLGVDSAT